MPNGKVKIYDENLGRYLKPGELSGKIPSAIPSTWDELTAGAPTLPATWQELTTEYPLRLKAPTGEDIEARVKPDKTVFVGGEQVGTVDPQGQFIPSPPTAWEQFTGGLKTAGLKGIEYLFKPFELFGEYVGVPFAMGVTAPLWQKKWWESKTSEEQRELIAKGYEPGKLAAESPLEMLKGFFTKESEFREAYHEAEMPKYLRGGLELIPWFFLPAIGQVGRAGVAARGIAGKLGGISPKLGQVLEYSPYGLIEKVAGKIIQQPIRVGKKLVGRLMMVKDFQLAGPKPIPELLFETKQLHPNLLNVKAFAFTTKQIEKVRVEKQWREAHLADDVVKNNLKLLSDDEVTRLASTINHRFTASEIFLLKKVPVAGKPILPEQVQVTAPWIKPKRKEASMYLRDVLEYPEDYTFAKTRMGEYARLWVEQYHIVRQGADNLAAEQIPSKLRPFVMDELSQVRRAPSRVVAQYDINTGKQLWRDEPWAGGTRGGQIAAFKPRKFTGRDSQKKAVELGYEYSDDPVRDLVLYTKGVYNMIGFDQRMSILRIPYEMPGERLARLGGDIVARNKAIEKQIKFLGGGITTITTKEAKTIIQKQPGVKALINSVLRGEVPTAGQVRALERRFPELGKGFREALDIPYPEFNQAIKGISKEIWTGTKITSADFRRTLDAVRAKRVAKVPEAVSRQAEEVYQIEAELAGLEEWLATEPASKLRSLIRRTGWYKGEVKNLTLKQYKDLTGKTPRAAILTADKKHVRWEYSLDDVATEMGYKSGDDLKAAIESAGEAFGRIDALQSELARVEPIATRAMAEAGAGKNVTAGELTETLDSLGVEAHKQIEFLSYLYRGVYKEAKAERQTALRQLLKDVDGEIATLRMERNKALPAFKKVREAALHKAAAEGRIVSIPGWMSFIIPAKTEWGITGRQIADELVKRFTPEKVNAIVSKASTLARGSVTLVAALDLSLMFIQGPLALGHDIQKWAQFQKSSAFYNMGLGLLRGIWNPKYSDMLIAQKGALLARYAPEGLVVSKAVDYLQPEIMMSLFKKWGQIGGVFGKIFGETYGRFGAGFGAGSLAGRIAIIENAERTFLKAGWSRRQIAEYANKITGVISSEALGVKATRRALESAGLFSPNYTRAYLMVMRDLFRGGLPAAEVRKTMAGMLAGGFLTYVGLCQATGQEPKLNPAPVALGGDGAEFMSFKIGGSIIGMPGFWYSAIRMMAAVTAAAEQDPERLMSLNWRENDFLKFWMGRTSPLVHLGDEILEQRDFLGRRLDAPEDWVLTIGAHLMTIAAQNLITRDPSEREGRFHRVGAEVFGLRAFPLGDWVKLRDMKDKYAQKDYGKPFDELNREQRDKLLEAYPDYKEFAEEASDKATYESGEDFEIWTLNAEKLADANYYGVCEDLARRVLTGEMNYREYLEESAVLRKVWQGREMERHFIESQADPDEVKRWEKWKSERPPEDQALDRYWEIRREVRRDPETGLLDWDTTERRLDQFLISLDEDTRVYVLTNKDRWVLNLPPTMRKLAEIQVQGRDVIDEYYNQPEGKARISYRKANPTVDAWLLVMGRVTRPQTQMALTIALELLRERGLPPTIIAGSLGAIAPPTGYTLPAPTGYKLPPPKSFRMTSV